jgi:PHD/YefM family antitoxin component YafN of YafNO toxin-antitoxin module
MSSFHPEYLVDDQNRKKAVVLPISEWRRIVEELEELDDIRAYDKAKSQPSESIEFDEAVRRMQAGEED